MAAHNDALFAAKEFAAGLPVLADSPEPASTGFRAALLEAQVAELQRRERELVAAFKELVAAHALLCGNDRPIVVASRRLIEAMELSA